MSKIVSIGGGFIGLCVVVGLVGRARMPHEPMAETPTAYADRMLTVHTPVADAHSYPRIDNEIEKFHIMMTSKATSLGACSFEANVIAHMYLNVHEAAEYEKWTAKSESLRQSSLLGR
jgi:hypothetical protein